MKWSPADGRGNHDFPTSLLLPFAHLSATSIHPYDGLEEGSGFVSYQPCDLGPVPFPLGFLIYEIG